jgi:hypothetical protein
VVTLLGAFTKSQPLCSALHVLSCLSFDIGRFNSPLSSSVLPEGARLMKGRGRIDTQACQAVSKAHLLCTCAVGQGLRTHPGAVPCGPLLI